MKLSILTSLLGHLFSMLTPEMLRKVADTMIDYVEKVITDSATTIDDAIVLPMLAMLREALKIPDDDEVGRVRPLKLDIITSLFSSLIELLTPAMLKSVIDSALDAIETAIADSETKTDDAVLLPLINLLRTTFDIPDNDEPVAVLAPA